MAVIAQLSSYRNQIVVHIHVRINDTSQLTIVMQGDYCCYIVQHSTVDSKEIL